MSQFEVAWANGRRQRLVCCRDGALVGLRLRRCFEQRVPSASAAVFSGVSFSVGGAMVTTSDNNLVISPTHAPGFYILTT
jgi:hypothetical protein